MPSSIAEVKQQIKDILTEISKYHLEIGVFAGKSKRKIKVGITNAELMFIHENGSPLHNIPARPVLEMTVNYARKKLVMPTIAKCIKGSLLGKNEIDLELNRLAIKVENYARQIIYSNDGRLTPNAPSTINKKGTNHPLFDTGQLARSITCIVVKDVI